VALFLGLPEALRVAEHIADLSRCLAQCISHSSSPTEHIIDLSCDRSRQLFLEEARYLLCLFVALLPQ
jgi:hypothetical protein